MLTGLLEPPDEREPPEEAGPDEDLLVRVVTGRRPEAEPPDVGGPAVGRLGVEPGPEDDLLVRVVTGLAAGAEAEPEEAGELPEPAAELPEPACEPLVRVVTTTGAAAELRGLPAALRYEPLVAVLTEPPGR